MSEPRDEDTGKTPILVHPTKRLDLLERGRELFNEEEFFEAHEAWERLWKLEQSRDRDFIQGLIQAAAHFVHVRKGNVSGARAVAAGAMAKLAVPPANRTYAALDIEPLVSALQYNLRLLDEHAGAAGRGPSFGAEAGKAEAPPPVPGSFLIPKLFPR